MINPDINTNINNTYNIYNDTIDIEFISHNLLDKLEKTPTCYYYELCELENKYSIDTITKIVNDTTYENIFNGNHLHALVYLTGKLKNKKKNDKEHSDNDNSDNSEYSENNTNSDNSEFYGKYSFVFPNLANYILEKLISYNIDLFCVNKNNHTPLDCLFINNITSRTRNTDFVIQMKTYY